MTAPATPAAPATPLVAGRDLPRGRRPARDRFGVLVEIWLRGHTWLVYGFLYLPIVVVVVFSFNANTRVTNWTGFSLHWYEFVLNSKEIQRNLINSLIVGFATATVSTIIGTMAALGIQRAPKWFRLPFDALTYVSLIVPEIVIALSTLVFFAVTIGRDGLLSNLTGGPEIGLGYHTIVGALSVFNISLVLLLDDHPCHARRPRGSGPPRLARQEVLADEEDRDSHEQHQGRHRVRGRVDSLAQGAEDVQRDRRLVRAVDERGDDVVVEREGE